MNAGQRCEFRSILATVRDLLLHWVWRPIGGVTRAFHLLPLIGALVLFLLLTAIAQVRELYISLLERTRVAQIFFALVSFALVSSALFLSHLALSPRQARRLRGIGGTALIRVNPYSGMRRYLAVALSPTPWLGLATGYFFAWQHLSDMESNVHEMTAAFELSNALSSEVNEMMGSMQILQSYTILAWILIAAGGLLVTWWLDSVCKRDKPATTRRLQIFIWSIIGALIVA